MAETYQRALDVATAAALRAGDLLRADLHRPDGARGLGDHADADTEAEEQIRSALTEAFPDWGYRGEETGRRPAAAGERHLWLVDPNDGTSTYLKGHRGSAVSVGLLRDGVPALGVVFAFAAPDDAGDLFAWAEGCGPLRRNGSEVVRPPFPAALGRYDVVLVSQAMDRKVAVNLECAAPARCRSMPSIAYRLALAAAGDGAVAVSLNSPGAWDYAGGHALLRAVGGELVDETGAPVRYSREGESGTRFCFGGAPGVVQELARRDWVGASRARHDPDEPYPLVRPERGRLVPDAGVLARAQGCLLGQFAGDALGALVEFQRADAIAATYPRGPRAIVDGGHWHTIAGQPTDDSELALALARSIVAAGRYDPEAAATAYRHWYHSCPFDCGMTIGQALGAIGETDIQAGTAADAAGRAASAVSESNGSLMRISPLAIWGCSLAPDALAAHARDDARLTHQSVVAHDAAALFVVAIAHAMAHGGAPRTIYDVAVRWAAGAGGERTVTAALRAAESAPPADFVTKQGWLLVALQNAFYRLLHSPTLEEGIVETVAAGGDTDTNAAIAGALLGAAHGRDAVPHAWRQMVLTCRPLRGLPEVVRPRPRAFWPVDALELAERLLWLGQARR